MSDDDIDQELALNLLYKCIPGWRPRGGCNIASWIEMLWTRRLASLLNAATRNHTMIPLAYSEEITPEMTESLPSPPPSGTPGDIEELRLRATALLQRGRLARIERSVLELRLQGLPFREIARRMGVSEKCVDNAMQRVVIKSRRRRL